MKKNFKRNKIILCSLLGLAVISSGTIAFSTWIFGLNNGEQQIDGIKVTVDGYKDNTKYLDIATSNNETITLAEYSEIKAEDNVASTEGITSETKKADFDINLSKFEFAFSTSQYTFNSIDFTLLIYKTTDTSETKNDVNKVTEDQVHGKDDSTNHLVKMRESKTEGYTYLALETSVTSNTLTNNFTTETIGDYTYYTAKDDFNKLTLKWGDYFGNNVTSGETVTKASPAIFYNNKYTEFIKKENIGVKDKLEFLNTANSEMKAMEEVFKDVTIKITATLNLTDKTNNG